jgi:hypothetical protein
MCIKHKVVWLIGVANKIPYLGLSRASPNDLKHNEAGSLTILTDLLCLRVAQVPTSQDLTIFMLTTDNRQIDTQTDCFTPAAHVHKYKDRHVFTCDEHLVCCVIILVKNK